MSKHLSTLCVILVLGTLVGCPAPRPGADPDPNVVAVPISDPNPPTAVGLDVYDPDLISVGMTSQPVTIIAVSNEVTVVAGATDEDGGIKALKLWATYTYYRPGQTSGPGLAGAPLKEYLSDAVVGGSARKSPFLTHTFKLKDDLRGWSRIKIDIQVEGENFYGGKVKTPLVSITYPTRQDGDTDYMAFCRQQRVPIPPNWALTGTAWVYQGLLQTNLLIPGGDAHVWTYSDPVRRGAAIALPRGNGGQRGGLAGIISQSATTGRACFWDSRKRDDQDPLREMPKIDWGAEPLAISQLKDASNLTEEGSGRCPDCHRGDNVFLISPDDPTWAKVIRGPLPNSPGSTFTTRVESSSDRTGGHPRYVPVTYPANRPDWVNAFNFAQGGDCASCHENPIRGFTGRPKMSPGPDCAGPEKKVELCYK